jgi:hypothetical protein
MLDAHVANAAGGFAADAVAGKNGIDKGAVRDADIVSRPVQRIALLATPRFE